jgi:hypothetical protein
MKDKQLFNFLEGKSTDFRDRYISDILNFSDRDIEEKYDFIQWVFPTDEPSSIARVIKCLRLLLGDEEADDFKQKVYGIFASTIMFIDEAAKRYWAKA